MKTTYPPPTKRNAPARPASNLKVRLVALFFIATTITAGYVAWTESRQITDLQAQLAKRAATVAVRPAVRSSSPAPTGVAPVDTQQSAPEAFASLLNNPQVQEFVDARIGQVVDSTYADLFQQLNLSQADSDNLRGLLMQRATAWRDVMTNAANQGLDPATDRDQMRQMMNDAQGQVDNNIHQLLGDANYQIYQTYNANVQPNLRGAGGLGLGGGFGGGGGPGN